MSDGVVTRMNERGILETVPAAHGRALAAEDVAHAEALQRRLEQYGYLSPRDEQRLVAYVASATDLLTQTGDYKERPTDIPRPWRSPAREISPSTANFDADDAEPQSAKLTKEEAREQRQAVLDRLPQDQPRCDRDQERRSAEFTCAVRQAAVSCRLDRELGMCFVSGRGETVQFASTGSRRARMQTPRGAQPRETPATRLPGDSYYTCSRWDAR